MQKFKLFIHVKKNTKKVTGWVHQEVLQFFSVLKFMGKNIEILPSSNVSVIDNSTALLYHVAMECEYAMW